MSDLPKFQVGDLVKVEGGAITRQDGRGAIHPDPRRDDIVPYFRKDTRATVTRVSTNPSGVQIVDIRTKKNDQHIGDIVITERCPLRHANEEETQP